MKNKFDHLDLKSLVLHWDSKLLPDITGKYKLDWLLVIVTAANVEQLLQLNRRSTTWLGYRKWNICCYTWYLSVYIWWKFKFWYSKKMADRILHEEPRKDVQKKYIIKFDDG
jgi:hypothetical protein